MELVQGTGISKHWTKILVQALQDSRVQEVPSPGTLLKLMIPNANRARSRGEETLSKNERTRHRGVDKTYPAISTDGGTKLSWLAAEQISRASSMKAIRVVLAVWSCRRPLHPTVQEARVIITKVYPAMSKVGS